MDSVNRPGVFQVSREPRIRETPSHVFSCLLRIRLLVNMPYSRQLSRFHPNLSVRLTDDWENCFAFLNCSTGGFSQALNEGKVCLGHAWAEVFALCLQQVFCDLYGINDETSFDEQYWIVAKSETSVEYMVQFQFSAVIDGQFTGLVGIVTEYLNAIMEGCAFDIKERLEEFVSSHNHPGQAQTIRPTRSARRKRRACCT